MSHPKNLALVALLMLAVACGKDDAPKSNNADNNGVDPNNGVGDMANTNSGGDTGDGDPDMGGASDMALVDMGPVGESVVTTHGPVQGTQADGVISFKGVPYAAPPVGDLRFRPPQDPAPWAEPRDASLFGPVCPQRDLQSQQPIGDEDCLTLNVWAPSGAQGRPVMVFIHGGGFVQGASSYPLYDGRYLASRDVVVVTLNYRIGALGFLAAEELAAETSEDTAGNYGLLDQMHALQWVQDNIAAFGGDPDNVTLFGESAGGSSICGHLGSPMADGLFDRVIIESGGGCGTYPYLRTGTLTTDPAIMIGTQFVAEVGCAGSADVAQCLRDVPAATAVTAQWNLDPTGLGLAPFGLNIDGTVLPDLPIERFRDGNEHDVPIITGSNADEATIFTATTPVPTVNAYERLVRTIFGQTIGNQILAVYPAADFDSPKDAYNQLFSDVTFVCTALRFADAASGGSAPSYSYHFTQVPAGAAGALGSFHGLELTYVFGTFAEAYPAYVPTADDLALRDRMMGDWVAYAQDGTVPWAPYDLLSPEIQIYGTPSETVDEIRDGRCTDLAAIGVLP